MKAWTDRSLADDVAALVCRRLEAAGKTV